VGPLGLRAVAKSTARILVAALPLGVVVFFIARQAHWERGGNDPQNVVVFVVAVATGSASYLLAAKLLRAPELDDTFGALVRKLRSRMSR
jgi:hypothetical protein